MICSSFISLSSFFQVIIVGLVVKYSVYFIMLSEVWVLLILTLSFIFSGVEVFFLYFLSVLLTLSFLVEIMILLMFTLGLKESLMWLVCFFTLKQAVLLLSLIVFKFKDSYLSFMLYVFNSKFSYFSVFIFLTNCLNVKWFLKTVCQDSCMSIGGIMLWCIFYYILLMFIYKKEVEKYMLSFVMFSQFMLLFSLFLGISYFFMCFWVDLIMFLLYFYMLILKESFLKYLTNLESLNFYLLFIVLTFLLSLPPSPSFYVEMGYFFWVYTVFKPLYFYLSCFILFLVVLFYFLICLTYVFKNFLHYLRVSSSFGEFLMGMYSSMLLTKVYEVLWVFQFNF